MAEVRVLPGGRVDRRPAAARAGFGVLLVLLAVGVLGGERLRVWLDPPAALRAWSTVFVSVSLQSLPFLVLGVALSAAITVGLPIDLLVYPVDSLDARGQHRIEEADPYFRKLGMLWNEGLKRAFASIPVPDGFVPKP